MVELHDASTHDGKLKGHARIDVIALSGYELGRMDKRLALIQNSLPTSIIPGLVVQVLRDMYLHSICSWF